MRFITREDWTSAEGANGYGYVIINEDDAEIAAFACTTYHRLLAAAPRMRELLAQALGREWEDTEWGLKVRRLLKETRMGANDAADKVYTETTETEKPKVTEDVVEDGGLTDADATDLGEDADEDDEDLEDDDEDLDEEDDDEDLDEDLDDDEDE